MKILVDHGGFGNLGDTSMVESVVFRLVKVLPQAEIFVIHSPDLRSPIWDLPNVSTVRECSLKPFLSDIFGRRRFFWRLHNDWQKIGYRLALQSIGTLMPAGSVSLYSKDNLGMPNKKLEKFCEEFDALHIVGGGNLTDVFLKVLLNKCGFIHTFSEQAKPILLTGQQIGPFILRFSERALRRALRKANFIGLREPSDSLKFCKEARIEPECYGVMGDDSLGLRPSNDSFIFDVLGEYGLKEKDFISVNIRIARYAKEHADYIKKVALVIEKIATHFHKPVLIVPIALRPSDSDITSGKKLVDEVHRVRVLLMDNVNMTPALVKGVLGKSFGAVGVSYHFCIFALSQGVPAVCLYDGDYYSQKARGICSFWGDNRLALPLRNMDTDLAVKHISRIFEDGLLCEKLRQRSREATEQWQSIFDKQVSHLFGRFC